MCRKYHSVECNAPFIRQRRFLSQLPDKGLFIYVQSLRDPAYELQRVKLSLLCDSHRPRRLDGQFSLFRQNRARSEPCKRFRLMLQSLPVLSGIDKRRPDFIITLYAPAQSVKLTDSLLIGVKIHLSLL